MKEVVRKLGWKWFTMNIMNWSIQELSQGGGCALARNVNQSTKKYHFPLPFMDQMLERLVGHAKFGYDEDLK